MKRKALLTGGTGYIGRHLAQRLLQDHWEVHLLVRDSSNLEQLRDLSPKPTVHFHQGTTQLVTLLRELKPEVVLHLASQVEVDHQPLAVESLIKSNILFGTQLLEGMSRAGVRAMVNTGSYWQHFDGADYNPVNLYAATKQAFADILRFYTASGLIRAVTLKLYDVYGPNDRRNKLFQQLDRAYQKGESLVVSPGEQQLDFVYIDDVVEAFCAATERLLRSEPGQSSYETFFVTSERFLSLKKVVEIYEWVTGRHVKVIWGGRSYRKREVMNPWCGNPLPGWRAGVGLETGIQRMVSPCLAKNF